MQCVVWCWLVGTCHLLFVVIVCRRLCSVCCVVFVVVVCYLSVAWCCLLSLYDDGCGVLLFVVEYRVLYVVCGLIVCAVY